ncbi:ABC transporter ATP-binding protein [Clostridium neonatale]|uniref:ABC transporter ATP-binding protein n=1 Tax=Clostridium neonatale TaxID=137838 RepID=UPI00291C17C9|nr:ABC transporter ATP-binding protein [Clostridium neonatale]CAI3200680.1 ABC transporter ATP-binding protein [Clostridium neonatale]
MSNSGYIIKKVCKNYEVNNEQHMVLNNISLNISTEDITVILGESGCGKTTFLRIIAGLENVTSGEISYIKDNKEFKPKVGMVFQESRLMDWLNVSENITFHNVSNRSKKNNKNAIYRLLSKLRFKKNNSVSEIDVDKYLSMMKLEKFKNSYPGELSGGMAQRVSIARALSFDPDMLLMDEPFSALDYFTRKDMQNEVIRIHESTNKGVIFVTHDIDEALKIADKIIVFTLEREFKEYKINDTYNRDLTSNYYVSLKKEILHTLKSNIKD